jgi:thiol-disulfide isomerase/thioredoxin
MDDALLPDDEVQSKPLWRRALLVARDWGLSLLVVALLFHLLGTWRAPDLPEEAPGFVLRDLDGEEVALDSFRGKPVVLNFWATWCGPCRTEIPSFVEFAQENPDVVVLGVAVDGSPSELRAASERLGIDYPVLIATDEIKAEYGVETLPTTVIIDPEGEVHSAHSGMMFGPQLEWATRKW